MDENKNMQDIYKIDTSDLDLAKGIEEDDFVDIQAIIKKTKQKLHKKEKSTLRKRFFMSNNMVKAAVIAGIILIGGTTAAAATFAIVKYIPNMGVSQSDDIRVLPVPFTNSIEVADKAGKMKSYYLRIVALSYNGKVLEMDLETNWKERSYDDKGNEIGARLRKVYLRGKEEYDVKEMIDGKSTVEQGEEITRYHAVFEVDKLEEYSLSLSLGDDDDKEFIIPLSQLTLVEPKEAKTVEQLGQVSVNQEIRLVAVESQLKDNRNIDFVASKPAKDIDFKGLYEYTIKNEAGKVLKAVNAKNNPEGSSYVLLKGDESSKGSIEASSILVSKKINNTVQVKLPKPGQTDVINKTISLNGLDVVIKSVSVPVEEKIDKKVRGYWPEVALELNIPHGSKYSVQSETQIINVLSYKGIEQASYSYQDGKTYIGIPIPSKEFEAGTMMTLQLDHIEDLVLAGNWKWRLK